MRTGTTLGGIDLFPKAQVWIQKEEFRYYTGEAWQPGGDRGGIDPDDVLELVRSNTEGRLNLIDGDKVEIFRGIRAYTGGRHTFASQYLAIAGTPNFVLASDNVYLYRNLIERKAGATFMESDHAANVQSQARMIALAGSSDTRPRCAALRQVSDPRSGGDAEVGGRRPASARVQPRV